MNQGLNKFLQEQQNIYAGLLQLPEFIQLKASTGSKPPSGQQILLRLFSLVIKDPTAPYSPLKLLNKEEQDGVEYEDVKKQVADTLYKPLLEIFTNEESGILQFLKDKQVKTLLFPVRVKNTRGNATHWYFEPFTVKSNMLIELNTRPTNPSPKFDALSVPKLKLEDIEKKVPVAIKEVENEAKKWRKYRSSLFLNLISKYCLPTICVLYFGWLAILLFAQSTIVSPSLKIWISFFLILEISILQLTTAYFKAFIYDYSRAPWWMISKKNNYFLEKKPYGSPFDISWVYYSKTCNHCQEHKILNHAKLKTKFLFSSKAYGSRCNHFATHDTGNFIPDIHMAVEPDS
jgi:glycosyltransferase involved in cell wall biosynthesis